MISTSPNSGFSSVVMASSLSLAKIRLVIHLKVINNLLYKETVVNDIIVIHTERVDGL